MAEINTPIRKRKPRKQKRQTIFVESDYNEEPDNAQPQILNIEHGLDVMNLEVGNVINLDHAETLHYDEITITDEPEYPILYEATNTEIIELEEAAAVTSTATEPHPVIQSKQTVLFSNYFKIIEIEGKSIRAQCKSCQLAGNEKFIRGFTNVSSNFVSHLRVSTTNISVFHIMYSFLDRKFAYIRYLNFKAYN